MVRVKVCGLTNKEDVEAAVDAGADAVGVIVGFSSSPRNRTLEEAAGLFRCVPPFVCKVLVTTAEIATRETEAIRSLSPGAIQVYGRLERPEVIRETTGASLILPVRVGGGEAPDMESVKLFDAVLTDTYHRELLGGTGRVSDWSVCRALREELAPKPLVLSGGLNPRNVAEAVRAVGPYAVDVSSGVESSPGKKDRSKMAEFVRAAREAS